MHNLIFYFLFVQFNLIILVNKCFEGLKILILEFIILFIKENIDFMLNYGIKMMKIFECLEYFRFESIIKFENSVIFVNCIPFFIFIISEKNLEIKLNEF